MSLPDLIEIVPLDQPVHAKIAVPGSKSITNRALILAALADGETTLQGALWSEDTRVMVAALRKLGFEVQVELDPREFCNRTITVKGMHGKIPNAGTQQKPLEIAVGNAGTAARFLAALVCLGHGVYRLHGVPRMHERPQAALFCALRELGYRLDSATDRLPVLIHGTGPRAGTCRVSIEHSSQFASGLLLCAKTGQWQVQVTGENSEESPYVTMTSELIETLPNSRWKFQIEPDASSGSYFWAFGALQSDKLTLGSRLDLPVTVADWPGSGWQKDADFPFCMPIYGVVSPTFLSRQTHLGDSIMTAIVMAPFVENSIEFADLGRLRLQECERVAALRNELTKCGAKVVEHKDTLKIFPSRLHGAEIETYDDHRMAMCFAILGLKAPGIKIRNPACVKKTFPNFFQKLAASPPQGLGATILDGHTGQKLSLEQLFAD